MPRQARLDFPGTLHHALGREIEKQELVTDARDRDNFVTRLGQSASASRTVIYAWLLMTNHAHILLRSSPRGISQFMRKLLTGYAVSYNLRQKRHGYLFQNRYKSLVCEEDPYFHLVFC
jgi:putative transposase